MTFHIITIFPEVFENYFSVGVLGRGRKKQLVDFKIYDLRAFAFDKHRKVDDTPFGGGPGMVLKIEPIFRALEKIKSDLKEAGIKKSDIKTIVLSAKGKIFNQKKAVKFSSLKHLILIAGRYEGIDERVAENLADEEISVGRFVLSGGEIPAMLVVDAVTRLVPGVLGNVNSLTSESYNPQDKENEKDFPVYTQPRNFRGWQVPEILFSGDHQKIKNWRNSKRK